jgi:hypothetical protein
MKEVTNKFKKIVEFWCEHAYKKTLFYNRLHEGTLTKQQAALFHYNAEVVIQNTLKCMAEAGDAAFKLGNKELGDFFKQKVKEEEGHDSWAKEDYLNLDLSKDELEELTLTPGALKLINKLHQISRFSPLSMLAYVFFGEYHYTIIGPDVDRLYKKTLQKESKLVHSHGVLDVEHVKDDIQALNNLMEEGQSARNGHQDILECMNYQIEFYNELCSMTEFEKETQNDNRISA